MELWFLCCLLIVWDAVSGFAWVGKWNGGKSATAAHASRYVPEAFYENARHGRITPTQLERIFCPSSDEYKKILNPTSVGFASIILSCEGVLVDMTDAYMLALSVLASELQYNAPDSIKGRDIMGLSVRGIFLALGWEWPDSEDWQAHLTARFFLALSRAMDLIDISPYRGSESFVEAVLRDGNKVAVVTALPASLAGKALDKSGMSALLNDHIPSEHFLSSTPEFIVESAALGVDPPTRPHPHLSTAGLPKLREYLHACAVLQSPTALSVVFESNHKHVVEAKRGGLSCFAVKGNAAHQQLLRGADRVLKTMQDVALSDLYAVSFYVRCPYLVALCGDGWDGKVVRRALKQTEGPPLQAAVVPQQQQRTTQAQVLTATRDKVARPRKVAQQSGDKLKE